MTKQQAEWAKLHDWFDSYLPNTNGSYIVWVREESHHEATGWTTTMLAFTSFTKLRDWAGY